MRSVRILAVAAASIAVTFPLIASAQEPAQPAVGSGATAGDDAPMGTVESAEEAVEEVEATPPPSVVPEPKTEKRKKSEDPVDEVDGAPNESQVLQEVADHEETKAHHPEPAVAVADHDPEVGVSWNRGTLGEDYPWSLDLGGYLRVGYTGIQDDPSGTFGQHDGFGVANARLAVTGTMRSLGFKLQLDAAVDQSSGANDASAIVDTRLKDAYVAWRPFDFAHLTVGQFKPPFDVEEQISTSQLLFVNRSVGSRGVKDVEGRNVEGLSADRQVGIELGSPGYYFLADDNEPEGPGVSYGIALTNGQSASRALNDNDKLAGYGRVGLHWGEMVSAGGAYSVNSRTLGVDPDTIDEDVSAWTADIVFDSFGLTVIGSVTGETIARPGLQGVEPETTGFAYQAQLAYKEPFLGFQPAFRYAYFDPTERADATDELTYITFGLNYVPPYPVRLLLNYTLTQESDALALANNRFDAVLQVTW